MKVIISLPNTLPYSHTAAAENMMDVMSGNSLALVSEMLKPKQWSYHINRQPEFPMDINRNKSVKVAIEQGADYLIGFDADMIFPVTVVRDLIRTMLKGGEMYDPVTKQVRHVGRKELDVVSGLYFKKAPPFPPIGGIFTRWDDPRYHTPINTDWNGLTRCDVIGCGCMIVKVDALKKIDYPWFKYDDVNGGEAVASEDVWFSRQCYEKKLGVWMDTNIKCLHLTSLAVGVQHWNQFKKDLFDPNTGGPRPEQLPQAMLDNLMVDLNTWPGQAPREGNKDA